ncbi:hypothetical protein H5410_002934 [Solanum commersonii]|uniref:Elongation factor P n=1 Tax=Solanum commersonii TaxID=4109 RepID=A0A9J6B3D6_SOLCO|nr:hypothetical protein H5410_002934 [Solanum commersonii]
MMRVVMNRLSRALWDFKRASSSIKISRALSTCIHSKQWLPSPYRESGILSLLRLGPPLNSAVPNLAVQMIYQVVKAQHTTQGRGGAIIQFPAKHIAFERVFRPAGYGRFLVELRDVDSGSKSNERFRTDETVERVFVAEKSFTYLYTDEETGNIVLMEPETYEQLDVPKHLFGECYVYLQGGEKLLFPSPSLLFQELFEKSQFHLRPGGKFQSIGGSFGELGCGNDMKVNVQLYNERATSASIPTRVTCTVAESEIPMRASATPQYKKVLLDNGLTVQVPKHIVEGDKIIVNTIDHSYMSRKKELGCTPLRNEVFKRTHVNKKLN